MKPSVDCEATRTVFQLIYPFMSIKTCFMHVSVPCWVCKCLLELYPLVGLVPLYYVVSFVSYYSLGFKVYFGRYKYCSSRFFLFHLHEVSFSNPFLVCVYLSIWCGSLGGNIYMGLIFLSIQLPAVFWLEHLSPLHLR